MEQICSSEVTSSKARRLLIGRAIPYSRGSRNPLYLLVSTPRRLLFGARQQCREPVFWARKSGVQRRSPSARAHSCVRNSRKENSFVAQTALGQIGSRSRLRRGFIPQTEIFGFLKTRKELTESEFDLRQSNGVAIAGRISGLQITQTPVSSPTQ